MATSDRGDTTTSSSPDVTAQRPLEPDEHRLIDAYWRAANYLSVGQIYLLENPLLREPLRLEHLKPRLLGHWGTSLGLNFIFAHANRVINKRDLDSNLVADADVSAPGAKVPTLVVKAREDVEVAREVRRVLSPDA